MGIEMPAPIANGEGSLTQPLPVLSPGGANTVSCACEGLLAMCKCLLGGDNSPLVGNQDCTCDRNPAPSYVGSKSAPYIIGVPASGRLLACDVELRDGACCDWIGITPPINGSTKRALLCLGGGGGPYNWLCLSSRVARCTSGLRSASCRNAGDELRSNDFILGRPCLYELVPSSSPCPVPAGLSPVGVNPTGTRLESHSALCA